jgi:hypothetical protein
MTKTMANIVFSHPNLSLRVCIKIKEELVVVHFIFSIYFMSEFHCSDKFKGTVSRDFLLLVFFMNQFPPSPENTIRAVSNFIENLRRYSQPDINLIVCHRCR